MLATRYKLPPLEGDDVAMLMERDMLRRWGFLGQRPSQKQQSQNTTTKKNDNNGSSSSSSDDDSDDEDDDNESNKNQENNENKNGSDESQNIVEEVAKKNSGVVDKSEETVDNKENDQVDEDTNRGNVDEKQEIENNCTTEKEDGRNDERDSSPIEKSSTQETSQNDVTENKEDAGNSDQTAKEEEMEEENEENEKKHDTECVAKSTEEELKSESKKKKKEMSGEVLVLYEEASRHYDEKDFCECLLSVEEALELCGDGGDGGEKGGDDGDDVDLTPLWLLRAKVMNSMENYKEALRSAYKVMAKERPSRMWIEGAIAMEKLGIQVTAELWIAMGLHKWKEESVMTSMASVTSDTQEEELWNAAVDDDVMCVLKMMQNRLRMERIYGPLVKNKPIKVISSLKYNRTIHATRKIKRGEIIFHEVPDILEQNIRTHQITACAECAKSLIQPDDVIGKGGVAAIDAKPNVHADIKKGLRKIWPKLRLVSCSFCSEVKYCSEECRRKSWDNHHKVICPSNPESTAAMLYDVRRSFRDVMAADGSTWQGWWNTEFSPTLLSRMMAVVLCKANLLADLRTQESYGDAHWSMCESILEKYSSCDKMKAADQVPKIQELLNNIFKRSKFLRYDVTKDVFNKRFSQAITNVIQFHDTTHPMNNFSQRLKSSSSSSSSENSSDNHKLFKKMKKYLKNEKSLDNSDSTIAEFHGLFPLASCINHSCYPNAVAESAPVGIGGVGAQPGIAVKAVRDIREGDEVLIAYVDPLVERHERRKILWRKYKFVCDCPRCLHQGIGPHICTNCGKMTKVAKAGRSKTKTNVINCGPENEKMAAGDNADVEQNHDTQHHQQQQPPQQQPISDTCCTSQQVHHTQNDDSTKPDANNENSSHNNDDFVDDNKETISAECQEEVNVTAESTLDETSVRCNNEGDSSPVNDGQQNVDGPDNDGSGGGGDGGSVHNADCTFEKTTETPTPTSSDATLKTVEQQQNEEKSNNIEHETINQKSKIEIEIEHAVTKSERDTDAESKSGEEISEDKSKSDEGVSNTTTSDDGGEGDTKYQETPATESKEEPTSGGNGTGTGTPLVFAACGRCKKAWYCSVECQKESWTNGHKRICSAPQQ